jgi:hypothetical protein
VRVVIVGWAVVLASHAPRAFFSDRIDLHPAAGLIGDALPPVIAAVSRRITLPANYPLLSTGIDFRLSIGGKYGLASDHAPQIGNLRRL